MKKYTVISTFLLVAILMVSLVGCSANGINGTWYDATGYSTIEFSEGRIIMDTWVPSGSGRTYTHSVTNGSYTFDAAKGEGTMFENDPVSFTFQNGILKVNGVVYTRNKVEKKQDNTGPIDPNIGIMPNVVNKNEQEAKAALDARVIQYEITKEANDTITRGMVMSQTPDANTKIKEGETVVLVVCSGPKSSIMPDLSNLTLAEAEKKIEEMGLVSGSIQNRASEKPDGCVLDQDPKPGSEVAAGDAVDIWVSEKTSESVYTMPSVVNASLEDAKARLNAVGFQWIRVIQKSSAYEQGTVLEQKPEANTAVVSASAPVEITISELAKMYHAPLKLSLNIEQPNTEVLVVILDNDMEFVAENREADKGTLDLSLTVSSTTITDKTVIVYVNGRETSRQQLSFK